MCRSINAALITRSLVLKALAFEQLLLSAPHPLHANDSRPAVEQPKLSVNTVSAPARLYIHAHSLVAMTQCYTQYWQIHVVDGSITPPLFRASTMDSYLSTCALFFIYKMNITKQYKTYKVCQLKFA